ncbi:ABC transporter substrate-binding protein [Dactylosporangium sp. NPDC049525]|uniref:ABC transporter substrate-binding protein n=1 Tax=Dactylosporangium sp. NPDC049525 TaxID=3154730 RepID=UPI003412C6C7
MRRTPPIRVLSRVLSIAAATLLLAACADTAGDTAQGTAGCEAYQQYGTFKGKTVSLYSGIVAPEDEPHINSYKTFERCTGIQVEFQGEKEFDTQVQVRIKGGNPPDLAIFAQPGLVKQLVETGKAVQAPDTVVANVKKFWSESWQGYVTVNGKVYGAPLGANVKSFVWYSPKEFKAKGYEVPKTLDELKALSEKIAAAGQKPWCVGIGSGDATGWPVTDWMEDMMLRLSGPKAYDDWVNHTIPFNGPEATGALDAVGEYLKNPAFVNGGLGDVKSVASTQFQDAGLPILQGQCSLHRQGSFYAQNWPKGVNVAPDGDIYAFYFPSKDDTTKPVLGGGEFVVAFSDRPEVKAFQTFLASDTWANEKVASTPGGGWISANTGMDASKLTNPIDKLSAQILQDPKSVFRYDGSDQMPGAVGTNAFWKQGTNWVTGQSTKATLDAIEAAWPK